MRALSLLAAVAFVLGVCASSQAAEKLKVLIVDGQNNHNWKATTPIMKRALEESGLFTVEVATSPPNGQDLSGFKPNFAAYDAVVSNYNGAPWPAETEKALEDYVQNGGGLVIVHAANNSFPGWQEYNRMIGLGGWGGRNEKSGPYVYVEGDKVVRNEQPGGGGHHGSQHPFQIVVRNPDHPITRGMPRAWMHTQDELYDKLRGPAESMEILATAHADPAKGGSDRHEPMIMTIDYGKGRVFHTPMGHADYSMRCVGFITTLQRGTEWAATGDVTQKIPADFPKPHETAAREY